MTLNMPCEGSDSNIYIYASSHEKSERIKAEVVKPTRKILMNIHQHCSSSNKLQCLQFVRFVRPDKSSRLENLTINQDHPARSVYS